MLLRLPLVTAYMLDEIASPPPSLLTLIPLSLRSLRYRVANGNEQTATQVFSPEVEMGLTKFVEIATEAIPGCVLQCYVLLKDWGRLGSVNRCGLGESSGRSNPTSPLPPILTPSPPSRLGLLSSASAPRPCPRGSRVLRSPTTSTQGSNEGATTPSTFPGGRGERALFCSVGN